MISPIVGSGISPPSARWQEKPAMMQVALKGCARLASLASSSCRLLFLVLLVSFHSSPHPSPTRESSSPADSFSTFETCAEHVLSCRRMRSPLLSVEHVLQLNPTASKLLSSLARILI
jgi:hypothetical protein